MLHSTLHPSPKARGTYDNAAEVENHSTAKAIATKPTAVDLRFPFPAVLYRASHPNSSYASADYSFNYFETMNVS